MASNVAGEKQPKERGGKRVATGEDLLHGYKPRTALGNTLREIRRRILAEGTPVLTPQGVAREVRKRRGARA